MLSVALSCHDAVADGGSVGVLLHLVPLLNEISSHLLLITCCHFVGCGAWRAVVSITLLLLSITVVDVIIVVVIIVVVVILSRVNRAMPLCSKGYLEGEPHGETIGFASTG